MTERLPSHVEADSLRRRAESGGGFATVVKRGDPDRGTIALFVAERGQFVALIERRMAENFEYRWSKTAENSEKAQEAVSKLARNDPDHWLIELDIADAQRFIADLAQTG